MPDFSSRFAVAITATDQTAEGADRASRSMSDALTKPTGAAKLAGTKAGDALEKGINRPLDMAKKKTGETDKAVRSLQDRIARTWHTGGMGKAFDGLRGASAATGELASGMGGMFGPMAGLTALLSGGGLIALLDGFGRGTNELARSSARYGVSTNMMQQWRGAARLTGLDANAATQSIGDLTQTLYAAKTGLPGGAGALAMAQDIGARTGIKLDLSADPGQFLRQFVRALQKLNPNAQRIATRAFGLEPLIDLLKKGPAAVDEFVASAQQLNQLTAEQIEAGDKLNRSFVMADLATSNFADTIKAKLSPTFTPLLDDYTGLITKLKQSPAALDAATHAVELLSAAVGITALTAVGKLTSKLIMFNSVWLKSAGGIKGALGLPSSAAATPGAAPAATGITPQGEAGTPAGAGMIGTGLGYQYIRMKDKAFSDAFAEAEKKFGPDKAGLRKWVEQYRKANPFVVPYGFEDKIAPRPGANDLSSPGWLERQWDWMRGGSAEPSPAQTPRAKKPSAQDLVPSPAADALAASQSSALAPVTDTARNKAAWSAAKASAAESGIPAEVTYAQWALESAHGTRMPKGSNNPFGIKARAGEPYVEAATTEVINGQARRVMARFRKFDTLADAFQAHADLLANSNYYATARRYQNDPARFADALTGVYATDPRYGAKLKAIMARELGPTAADLAGPTKTEQLLAPRGDLLRGAHMDEFGTAAEVGDDDDASPAAGVVAPPIDPNDPRLKNMPDVPSAYQPMDTTHHVEIHFRDAPKGTRADIGKASGPASIGVRVEYAMPG